MLQSSHVFLQGCPSPRRTNSLNPSGPLNEGGSFTKKHLYSSQVTGIFRASFVVNHCPCGFCLKSSGSFLKEKGIRGSLNHPDPD